MESFSNNTHLPSMTSIKANNEPHSTITSVATIGKEQSHDQTSLPLLPPPPQQQHHTYNYCHQLYHAANPTAALAVSNPCTDFYLRTAMMLDLYHRSFLIQPQVDIAVYPHLTQPQSVQDSAVLTATMLAHTRKRRRRRRRRRPKTKTCDKQSEQNQQEHK